jgi:hypothetical protein
MDSNVQAVYVDLVNHCRVLRGASDLNRAAAALVVERELTERLTSEGIALPEPSRRRRKLKVRELTDTVSA